MKAARSRCWGIWTVSWQKGAVASRCIQCYTAWEASVRRRPITLGSTIAEPPSTAWQRPAPETSASRAGGLAERAYAAIRDAIQEGSLGSGQRVPELELCAWLKISRTPVREALRRLRSEGMVEHGEGGGLSVARLDLRAVTELYDLRESLEGTAAALAARGADATEIRILQVTLDAHRTLPDDPEVHARENILFHGQVYRAAHNRFLLKSLQNLHDSVALLGRTTFAAAGRVAEAMQEHQAIVDAIARRDEAEAEVLARRHVRRGYELRVGILATTTRAGAQSRMEQRQQPP